MHENIKVIEIRFPIHYETGTDDPDGKILIFKVEKNGASTSRHTKHSWSKEKRDYRDQGSFNGTDQINFEIGIKLSFNFENSSLNEVHQPGVLSKVGQRSTFTSLTVLSFRVRRTK